jgi:hypothetical protein
MTTDLKVSYDSGWFDKDEQGWCARQVAVRHEGETVVVREWGDDNGARPYDATTVYRVGRELAEMGLVQLLNPAGQVARYFDLTRRELRGATEREPFAFVPPAEYTSQAAREALAEVLLPVARALGLAVETAPPMPLGEMRPSETAEGAVEAKGTATVEPVEWTWMRRFYTDESINWVGPQQMSVTVAAVGPEEALVSVFVQSPEKASLVLGARLEELPAARAAREEAIRKWTGRAGSA